MNTITFNTPQPFIKIIPISDVHVGDEQLDVVKLKELIRYIKDTPNVYTVLNGDIMNTAIKSSVSHSHDSTNPRYELKEAVKLFKPIADKILLVTAGNHEDRVEKATGYDLTELFCEKLGIEDKYVKWSGLLLIRYGDKIRQNVVSIYFSHGIGQGGGRRKGSKVNAVEDFHKIACNADCYVIGHVHTPNVSTDRVYTVDERNNYVKLIDRHYVITGSFMNYGGYGEKYNYPPQSNKLSSILLKDGEIALMIGGVDWV